MHGALVVSEDEDIVQHAENSRCRSRVFPSKYANQGCYQHRRAGLIRIVISEGSFYLSEREPHYDLSKDSNYFARLEFLRAKLLEMKDVTTEKDILKTNTEAGYSISSYIITLFREFFDAQVLARV
jgi:hypothetical protein